MSNLCGIGETQLALFISKLFGCGISLIGGVAILFIIYGGFVMLTSAGNPNKVREGREYITYAIVGLAIAILTFVILAFVGGNVLNLPGFNP